MFRSKKKKSADASGARKRKEIDADSGDEAPVASGEATGEQQEQAPLSNADVEMRDDTVDDGGVNNNRERAGGKECGPEGDDADEDEDALLARMRDRNAKRGKLKSAMTFSSKASSSVKKNAVDDAVIHTQSSAFGSLSFADDEVHKGDSSIPSSKRQGRLKIRPNLLPSNVVTEDEEADDSSKPANSYTFEMLDALRKEQKVLLRTAVEKGGEPEPQTNASVTAGDIDMAEVEGATIVLEEEQVEVEVQPAEEDEGFIPLHSKMMQSRKKRNRVTFGVHSSGPKLSKSTEVDEPTDSGDDENEDGDQSRKWEEELMRRGGHHVLPTDSDMSRGFSGSGGAASKKTYPTRRKVPNGSLSDVLTKLQRSFDAATFENDRAERELARIDAEVLLIEESVKKQRQELLTSSEEFEYFQVVEDYVKGLSFCLREKAREINANEKEIAMMRVANIRSIHDAEARHAREITNRLVETGAITDAAIQGLQILDAEADAVIPSVFSSGLNNEVAEKIKRGFVDRTPAIQQEDNTLDVFADAVDDMNSIQHVYGRFQEWRSKFPEVYKNCYCDIALEKLYAPYVRAELLFWDPLSVAKPTESGKAWGYESFEWFQVLRQHISSSSQQQPSSSSAETGGSLSVDDGPTVAQIRDVVLTKALDATTSYFDPFSTLHTRSICVLLEEMAKYDGYTQYCAKALTSLVTAVTTQFASESKLIPLIAVREKQQQVQGGIGSGATIYDFATYQLSRFNALLDNLLTFFVALPRDAAAGSSQTAGFRCVMQVLHHLLAFLSHCQRVHKMLLVPQAVQTVTQLTSSPYLQQLLASSSQEQELKHILALFAPFVAI